MPEHLPSINQSSVLYSLDVWVRVTPNVQLWFFCWTVTFFFRFVFVLFWLEKLISYKHADLHWFEFYPDILTDILGLKVLRNLEL